MRPTSNFRPFHNLGFQWENIAHNIKYLGYYPQLATVFFHNAVSMFSILRRLDKNYRCFFHSATSAFSANDQIVSRRTGVSRRFSTARR